MKWKRTGTEFVSWVARPDDIHAITVIAFDNGWLWDLWEGSKHILRGFEKTPHSAKIAARTAFNLRKG